MNIHQQIRDAIRPQLRDLRDLQKTYERQARLERCRRDWEMWDATDEALEWQITRTAFREGGASIATAYKQVEGMAETIFNAVKEAITPIYEEVAAGYAAQNGQDRAPAAPVPATDIIPHQDQ